MAKKQRVRAGKPVKKLSIPSDWTFRTPAVAAAFDAHVRESLPWYDFVTGAVAHFARAYIPKGGYVIDVGASTGNIGRALAPTLDQRNAYLLPIDNSEDMAKIYAGPGQMVVADAVSFNFAATTRPTRSGCWSSTPVSMTPTVTPVPSLMARSLSTPNLFIPQFASAIGRTADCGPTTVSGGMV